MGTEKMTFDLDAFDEECNRVRGHYVAALPSGVLSVHIKQVKKLDASHVTAPEPDVYVRIRVGKLIKCTQTTAMYKGRTVVDDIRHFSVNVSRKKSDPLNEIRMDLIVVEGSHVHRIVGHKDMHIYDVIKNLYIAGTYEFKYRQKTIAEVELEGCFTYGIFGFGYSHQLENRQKKLSDILGHSLLLRVEPPENRKQPKSEVMAPMPVGHPEIINFVEKVEIGSGSKDLGSSGTNLDVFEGMEKHEPVILARTMRKRLHRIQTDFAQQNSRLQRKRFLEKLILQHVEHHEPDGEADDDGPGSEDRPGTSNGIPGMPTSGRPVSPVPVSSLLAVTTDTYGDDDDYAGSVTDVAEIGNFLQNAPGIMTRARARGRPQYMPSDTSISSNTSIEDEILSPSMSEIDSRASSHVIDSTKEADEAREQDRRRSTLVELPNTILRGFAGRLRAWRTTRAQPAPETGTTLIVEGPSTSTHSTNSSASTTSMSAFRRRMQAQMDKEQFPENEK